MLGDVFLPQEIDQVVHLDPIVDPGEQFRQECFHACFEM